MLDEEFGKEFERRDHRFDRYADDICIYLKSERADQRVLESVSTLSDDRLKFNVNHHKKCRVALATKRGLLGFGFFRHKVEVLRAGRQMDWGGVRTDAIASPPGSASPSPTTTRLPP